MQMKEILKKLIDSGKQDALNTLEEVTEAAKELGYSENEIEEALDGFDGFPLDEEDLLEITGGMGTYYGCLKNRDGTPGAGGYL